MFNQAPTSSDELNMIGTAPVTRILVVLLATLCCIQAEARVDTLCEDLLRNGFETMELPQTSVVADAGEDQVAFPGDQIQLASQSDTSIAHCWKLLDKPAGSTAKLSDERGLAPTFLADRAGTYTARLVVHDGQAASAPDTVTVQTGLNAVVIDSSGGVSGSTDGVLSLDIPSAALSQPVSVGIRALEASDLGSQYAGADVIAAYELTPAGTQFSAPVAVEWNGEGGSSSPVAAIVESNGELEFRPTQFASNGRVSTTVEHFSRLIFIRFSRVTYDLPAVTAQVGQTFTSTYGATVLNGSDGDAIATQKTGAFSSAPQVLTPPSASPVSGLAYGDDLDITLPTNSTDTGTITGSCDQAGNAVVAVQVSLSGNFIFRIIQLLNPASSGTSLLRIPVICTAPGQASPVARNDLTSLFVGQTMAQVAILANDSDDQQIDPTSVQVVTQPRFGNVSVNAGGVAQYNANTGILNVIRGDSFEYVVADNQGNISNVARVDLRRTFAINSPPTAVDDMYTLGEGETVRLHLLANDIDSDGFLDPATLALATNPQGMVVINADGTMTYTAPTMFSGVDQFRYRVSDDDGALSNDATVFVTIGASTQIVAVDDNASVPIGTATDIDVLGNDLGPFDPQTLSILQQPQRGSTSVVNGMIRYEPFPGTGGALDGLLYQVDDGTGTTFSNAGSLNISIFDPNNRPPVAQDDQAQTNIDTPVTVQVFDNDFDPDGFLTVNVPEVVSSPANGTAMAQFGAIEYTPDPGFFGTDQFTYRIEDNGGLFSMTAAVIVDVIIVNDPPIANDDIVSVAMDTSVSYSVVRNDTDVDNNLDPASVVIVSAPGSGTASATVEGRIEYTPASGFLGMDSLTYTVADDFGEVSNLATVAITVSDFAGSNSHPLDNVSAAQLHFFSVFSDAFIDQGIGSFLGVFHASQLAEDNLTQIADWTWLFVAPQPSEQGAFSTYFFTTDLQQGSAQLGMDEFEFTGINPGPLYPDVGGTLTVEGPAGAGSRSISPPPTVVDGQGQPSMFRGDFLGLETQVQKPDGTFTHFLARIGLSGPQGSAGVLVRVPASELALDQGMRFRPILDNVAVAALAAQGYQPSGNVAFVFYNQRLEDVYFTAPGQREVPLAAGRGVSVPAAQLREPVDFCASPPVGTLCAAGPNEVLLAANQNGEVTIHDSFDGTMLGTLLGDTAPNFVVDAGWQIIQDPNTNCLLFSDEANDSIHLYDTDGSLIQSDFIDASTVGTSILGGPRGMDFLDGDLIVALNGQGKISRFTSNGEFVSELITGAGRPNGVFVDINGDVLVSDESGSSLMDRVVLYAADDRVNPMDVVALNLSTPYQIARLFGGNLALANFGPREIRVFEVGFPAIAGIDIPDVGSNTPNPRGIAPLKDGNWLITASDGTGVATIDPANSAATLTTIAPGSSYRFISRACLPAF